MINILFQHSMKNLIQLNEEIINQFFWNKNNTLAYLMCHKIIIFTVLKMLNNFLKQNFEDNKLHKTN